MRDPRIEDLDGDLRVLLDAEVGRPLPADLAAIQARVWAGVDARVRGPGPGGDGGDRGDGDGGGGGGGGGGAGPGGGPAPALGAAGVGLLGGLAVGGAVGVAVGGVLGVLVDRLVLAPTLTTAVPVPVLVEVPVAPAPPTPDAEPPVPAPPVAAPLDPPPEPVTSIDSERAVVDRARVALGRGDPQESMVALMEHARRFPRGQLTEERDRLTIEALVALGRNAEAHDRAEVFRATYPNSVHLPALDGL